MIAAIVYQLTRNLTPEQIRQGGFDAYFVDHTTGIYPQSASGVPFSASALQVKGDAITDLMENLAADAARLHNHALEKNGHPTIIWSIAPDRQGGRGNAYFGS